MDARHFEKHNPFRPPGWRYNRVLALVDDPDGPLSPSRRYDDQHVVDYRKFLLSWRNRPSYTSRMELFQTAPGLYYAHLLYQDADPEWRGTIEARLLAGQTDDEIADSASTIANAIHRYERIFFNVRDRLTNKDYIIRTILAPATRQTVAYDGGIFSDHNRSTAYKLFGYFGGPAVLDVMLSGFNDEQFPRTRDEVQRWFDRAFSTAARRRSSMAIHFFEVNRYNVMQLFDLHLRTMELEANIKAAGQQSGKEADFADNLAAVLSDMTLTSGTDAIKTLPKLLQDFSLTAVEPRAGELEALGIGMPGQELLDLQGVSLQSLHTQAG